MFNSTLGDELHRSVLQIEQSVDDFDWTSQCALLMQLRRSPPSLPPAPNFSLRQTGVEGSHISGLSAVLLKGSPQLGDLSEHTKHFIADVESWSAVKSNSTGNTCEVGIILSVHVH
uniref:Uncharacterized protein n=1 Tax=Photinus pyralis TaxID=7054 RepID=A0A1Y1LEF5_PHOPY